MREASEVAGRLSLEPGQAVGNYRVEATIGEGGMANVYLVRHQTLGTQHALKVLKLPTESVRERLIQEGRAQATLRHPNIVSVTDMIEVAGSPGLIMEYIAGPDVETLLANHRLSLEEATSLSLAVIRGIREAHRRALIHRDIKPGNVLLELHETHIVPKVTDFGLVKLVSDTDSGFGTRTGVAMGSPAYMSPEQIRDAKSVDQRADIFSLGTLLYELFCGRKAFPSDDIVDIFARITNGQYVLPGRVVENLPRKVERAITSAMEVDRRARTPDCETLLFHLIGQPHDTYNGPDLMSGLRSGNLVRKCHAMYRAPDKGYALKPPGERGNWDPDETQPGEGGNRTIVPAGTMTGMLTLGDMPPSMAGETLMPSPGGQTIVAHDLDLEIAEHTAPTTPELEPDNNMAPHLVTHPTSPTAPHDPSQPSMVTGASFLPKPTGVAPEPFLPPSPGGGLPADRIPVNTGSFPDHGTSESKLPQRLQSKIAELRAQDEMRVRLAKEREGWRQEDTEPFEEVAAAAATAVEPGIHWPRVVLAMGIVLVVLGGGAMAVLLGGDVIPEAPDPHAVHLQGALAGLQLEPVDFHGPLVVLQNTMGDEPVTLTRANESQEYTFVVPKGLDLLPFEIKTHGQAENSSPARVVITGVGAGRDGLVEFDETFAAADMTFQTHKFTVVGLEAGEYDLHLQIDDPNTRVSLTVPGSLPLVLRGELRRYAVSTARHYFYVPKGVHTIAAYQRPSIADIEFFAPGRQKEAVKSRRHGESILLVETNGSDGQVWSFRRIKTEPGGGFRFLNVPQAIAMEPWQLAVPSEAMGLSPRTGVAGGPVEAPNDRQP